jgi:hypothetical protein
MVSNRTSYAHQFSSIYTEKGGKHHFIMPSRTTKSPTAGIQIPGFEFQSVSLPCLCSILLDFLVYRTILDVQFIAEAVFKIKVGNTSY